MIYHCDCGALATKRDGSGYYCEACEEFVALIRSIIERKILEERKHTLQLRDRKEYQRVYQDTNRESIRVRKKAYNHERRHGAKALVMISSD